MRKSIVGAARWAYETYLVFVVIGLVIGLAVAPIAMKTTGGPDGTIAVIHIDGSIDGSQASRYVALLEEARENADAVVIVANSGGGSSVASEEMYMQTRLTAREIPVVVSVDAAALSGAYYAIAPADHIYVKPSSFVGSVGVVAPIPQTVEPNDIVGTTGPEKLTGHSGRAFFYNLQTVQQSFLSAVIEHRGKNLTLSRNEVASGAFYLGAQATRNGMADDIGGRRDAILHAADLADVDRPEVRTLGSGNVDRTFLLSSTYLASNATDKEVTSLDPFFEERTEPPTFLMVPTGVAADRGGFVSSTSGSNPLDNRSGQRVVSPPSDAQESAEGDPSTTGETEVSP